MYTPSFAMPCNPTVVLGIQLEKKLSSGLAITDPATRYGTESAFGGNL
jgi:hypothetical protein